MNIMGGTSASEHRGLRVIRERNKVFCFVPYKMLEALECPSFLHSILYFASLQKQYRKIGDFADRESLELEGQAR